MSHRYFFEMVTQKMKILIFCKSIECAILGHLWPVFGLLRPRYQFLKLSLSSFDLVQIESREVSEKIQNNNGLLMKMPILAMLGHFWPVFGL